MENPAQCPLPPWVPDHKFLSNKLDKMEGSSCSTAVERTPQNKEVMVPHPAKVLGFFSSLLNPLSSAPLIQVPRGGATFVATSVV